MFIINRLLIETNRSSTTKTAKEEKTIFLVSGMFDLIPKKASKAVPEMKANLVAAIA